jgi:hypothetical protein
MQPASTIRYTTFLLILLSCSNFIFAQAGNTSDSLKKRLARKQCSEKDTGRNFILVIAYHSGISRSYEFSIAKGHSVRTGGYPGYFIQYA